MALDVGNWDLRGKIFDVEQGNVFFSTLYSPNTTVGDQSRYCVTIVRAPCASPLSIASGGLTGPAVKKFQPDVVAGAWRFRFPK